MRLPLSDGMVSYARLFVGLDNAIALKPDLQSGSQEGIGVVSRHRVALKKSGGVRFNRSRPFSFSLLRL